MRTRIAYLVFRVLRIREGSFRFAAAQSEVAVSEHEVGFAADPELGLQNSEYRVPIAAPPKYGIRNTRYVVLAFVRSAVSIALVALREIFDENAYARFLERNQLRNSRAAYKEFLSETAGRRERRARCC